MTTGAASSVSAAEIAKFRRLQEHWWNPHGPLRTLHQFNPVRVQYINHACRHFSKGSNFLGPSGIARGMRVLDVGCGGGLLSESLTRLGGDVLGIDMCAESIDVAQTRREGCLGSMKIPTHAKKDEEEVRCGLDYRYASLHTIAEVEKKQFDLVIASEVLEHVEDAIQFVKELCDATKPGGLLIVSTMDKSLATAISHIAIAEYITGLVEPGTHDWTKFIPPKDLTQQALLHQVRHVDLQYILSYPDVFKSAVTRQLQLSFSLTNKINTGHYFWTGVKMHTPSSTSV